MEADQNFYAEIKDEIRIEVPEEIDAKVSSLMIYCGFQPINIERIDRTKYFLAARCPRHFPTSLFSGKYET